MLKRKFEFFYLFYDSFFCAFCSKGSPKVPMKELPPGWPHPVCPPSLKAAQLCRQTATVAAFRFLLNVSALKQFINKAECPGSGTQRVDVGAQAAS